MHIANLFEKIVTYLGCIVPSNQKNILKYLSSETIPWNSFLVVGHGAKEKIVLCGLNICPSKLILVRCISKEKRSQVHRIRREGI